MTRARIAAALALALAGLGAAAAAPRARKVVGSCTFPVTCQDYDASRDAARRRCDALGAHWSDAACPSARVVATCANAWDDGEALTRFYPPTTKKDAAAICHEGHGTLR